MQSSFIVEALKARGVEPDSAVAMFTKTTSRLRVAARELAPIGHESDNLLYMPYDDRSVVVLDINELEKRGTAFIKALFSSEDVVINTIDRFVGKSVTLVSYKALEEQFSSLIGAADLTNSAMIPFPELNASSHLVPDATIGLWTIVGLKSSGKSVMANGVLSPDVRIRHGEPKETAWDSHPQAIRASRFTSTVFAAVLFGSMGLVTSIDSLKNEAYRIKGSAGEKGIQPQLVLLLSDLALLASYLSAPLLALVNPMVRDEGMDLFADQVDSNVTGYIYMKRTSDGKASVEDAFVRHDGDRIDVSDLFSRQLEVYFSNEYKTAIQNGNDGYVRLRPEEAKRRAYTVSKLIKDDDNFSRSVMDPIPLEQVVMSPSSRPSSAGVSTAEERDTPVTPTINRFDI